MTTPVRVASRGRRPDRAVGLQRDEERAVGEEQAEGDQAAEQGDRVEQGEEVAGELLVGVDRHPAHDVGERDPPQQGRHERADDDRLVPAALPRDVVALVAVLEAEVAHDEGDEDEQQRQVEPAEHRGVPVREGREGGAAGREHPHLVAVPDRADRVEQHAAALLGVSASSPFPRTGSSMPTPKSKPSRTK